MNNLKNFNGKTDIFMLFFSFLYHTTMGEFDKEEI